MDENPLRDLLLRLLGAESPTVAPPQGSPAVRGPNGIVAPAQISPGLDATRDQAGSGLGGLMQAIGLLNGGGMNVRPAVPYRQGSGQSAERAIYGEGGGNYGSSPGQMTAGLAPGQRVYNIDTNSWGLKTPSGSSGGGTTLSGS